MIDAKEFVELTNRQDLLKGFTPQNLEKLAALAREVRFPGDQVIFLEGERHGMFYLILEGSVVLEIIAGGHPVLLQTLHSGDAMGWSALVDSLGGAHFQGRALTGVRALAFDGARVREACESNFAFGYAMMKSLLELVSERLDATRMQLVDMYATSPGAARA